MTSDLSYYSKINEYSQDTTLEYGPSVELEVPDVLSELRQTVIDQERGIEPTTVMGVLLEAAKPIPPEAIAGLIARTLEHVTWTLEVLEKESLVVRFVKDDIDYAWAFAPYEA